MIQLRTDYSRGIQVYKLDERSETIADSYERVGLVLN